jgi:hypothetical protein
MIEGNNSRYCTLEETSFCDMRKTLKILCAGQPESSQFFRNTPSRSMERKTYFVHDNNLEQNIFLLIREEGGL